MAHLYHISPYTTGSSGVQKLASNEEMMGTNHSQKDLVGGVKECKQSSEFKHRIAPKRRPERELSLPANRPLTDVGCEHQREDWPGARRATKASNER